MKDAMTLNIANTMSISATTASVPRLPAGLQATLTLSSKPGGTLLPLLLTVQPSSKKPRDVQTAGADDGVVTRGFDDAVDDVATVAARMQPTTGGMQRRVIPMSNDAGR